MPHLTIEYSDNVAEHHDINALVEVLHQASIEHELAPVEGMRTRAVGRSHYRIADGDPSNAFIAITARIGPGRSNELKFNFIEHVLDAAEGLIDDDTSPLCIAWSMEVTEIDPKARINRNHVRDRILAGSNGNAG